jgi:hypothetical protein
MPWFYVDDAFADSKPVMGLDGRLRNEATGLWTRCGAWSAKEETDGRVPLDVVRGFNGRAAVIEALADQAGLWEVPGKRDVQFKNWEKWQPTKAELDAERVRAEELRQAATDKKRDQRRKRKGRNVVSVPHVVPPCVPGDNSGDGGVDNPGTAAGTSRGGAPADVRPDPTRPENSSGYVSESATEPNGRGAVAATPAADLVRRTIPREINSPTQTDLRIRAGALLKEGTPADVVEEALREWATKTGVGPGVLPSLAADVIKRRNGHTKTPKLRGLAQLAHQERERENAQLVALKELE